MAFVDSAGTDDYGAGAALRQETLIARIAEKSDIALAGFVDGRDSVDNNGAVSDNVPCDMIGEFNERFTSRHLLLSPAIISFDHLARDIDPLVTVKNLRAF